MQFLSLKPKAKKRKLRYQSVFDDMQLDDWNEQEKRKEKKTMKRRDRKT